VNDALDRLAASAKDASRATVRPIIGHSS
jgi:hypothetical protein